MHDTTMSTKSQRELSATYKTNHVLRLDMVTKNTRLSKAHTNGGAADVQVTNIKRLMMLCISSPVLERRRKITTTLSDGKAKDNQMMTGVSPLREDKHGTHLSQ
jgi:hypothetical protein